MPVDHSPEESFLGSFLEAAREEALGRPNWFAQWPAKARDAEVDVLEALRVFAGNEQRILENEFGVPLGEAIGRAEDAKCLRVVEPQTTALLEASHAILDGWILSAEEAVLDEAACEHLVARRREVPLPIACRLAVVAVPLDEVELLMGASQGRPALIRLAAQSTVDVSPMALLDGGHPTPRLIERFEAREGETTLDGGEALSVAAQLDHWWGVRVLLDGGAADLVEGVRLGSLALEQDARDNGLWKGTLSGLDLATRLRLLALDICVRVAGDRRFLL